MSYQTPYNNQQRHYSTYGAAPPPNYGRRQTAPPGAGVDPMLYHWFQAIDTDKSGTLTTEELQRALLNGDWSPFNMETVRLMMNMFDTDNDGTITFKEFTGLWKYIEDWKRCFQTFDADSSGTIDFHELKTALKTFGYNLSDSFVDLLIKKYDKYGKGNVTFDNFVQSCVTIKTLTDAFRRFDTDNDGWIMISYEEFLRLVVNNR
ncbi:11269_t:CDS:2 [Paraglomus brasilianum]|uniref:11269_t:CDS:1 n=1 Tax=Paraglomus brasilianum TaxID=144538 RepID=A0A9N9C681_9GLOM|nr:11269_t:CDS:2 [Paraglomus brasilianum]